MSEKRPNIVIVVADDTTPSYHTCYGGPTPTPNIDRIANEGARMERGYCNASLCCPSRWTLFTGQFTGRSRWVWKDDPEDEIYTIGQNGMLDEDTPTLTKALRENGYFTGHIGKWHSRFNTEEFDYEEPIFIAGDADDPEVDTEIRKRQKLAQDVIKRTAGFEYVDRVNWGNLGGKQDIRLRAHNPMWMTDGALEFLDAAAQDDRPFYLHLANTVPHSPNCQLSLGVDHRYTWGGKLDKAPESHPDDETVFERMRAAGLQTEGPIAGVNAGIIMLDDQIGAVLKKIDEMGIADNTIVIYTADHGIPGKGSCYVTGQHLPFVIRWPKAIPAGQVVNDIYSWVDTVPTLASACEVTLPDNHIMDGVDVLPALQGKAPWPRQAHYHEMGWSRAIIKGRYQYLATRYPEYAIEAFKNGDDSIQPGIGQMFDKLNAANFPSYFEADQLYDLATDPFQKHNLIDDPTKAKILEDMKAELKAITDSMPKHFPADPHPYRQTDEFKNLEAKRREELNAIEHYPPNCEVPRVWFGNLHDPGAPDE